jgi:7,8-dihydroneopterin aldolase/epimerase/oxygenase
MPADHILIEGLDLATYIGVPSVERANLQVLCADLAFSPVADFGTMADRIERTIDYAAVADRLRALAIDRPRELIETLAFEMVQCVLGEFQATWCRVTLRKHILPGTKAVAVVCERHA